MAKELSYKRVTTTTLNFKGVYDEQSGTIELADTGETKTLTELYKGFDGELIDATVKIKSEEELDENLDAIE